MSQERKEVKPASPTNVILSTGNIPVKSGKDDAGHFAYYELQGLRRAQEDTLVRAKLPPLTLSPNQIAQRMWTTFRVIDQQWRDDPSNPSTPGTTACATVYNKGKLVTATLGDSVAFAAVWGKDGKLKGVIRLNRVISPKGEVKRITKAGGSVTGDRINGILGVSRAIGDLDFRGKQDLVLPNALIDVWDMDSLAKQCGIKAEDIDALQIITTCDGYTEPTGKSNEKAVHEAYLRKHLKSMPAGINPPERVAHYLAEQAIDDGSGDNVSVAVQTFYSQEANSDNPEAMCIFDGHGGSQTSTFAAERFLDVLNRQLGMDNPTYNRQKWSVKNNLSSFTADNKNLARQSKDQAFTSKVESKAIPSSTNEIVKTQPTVPINKFFQPEQKLPVSEETDFNHKSTAKCLSPAQRLKEGIQLAQSNYRDGYTSKYTKRNREYGKRWLTRWRHGETGQERVRKLVSDVSNLGNSEDIINTLDAFMVAKNRNTHIHSAFSYIMDEMIEVLTNQAKAEGIELILPKPNKRRHQNEGRYQKEDWETVRFLLSFYMEEPIPLDNEFTNDSPLYS